jgi:hypothetical protein
LLITFKDKWYDVVKEYDLDDYMIYEIEVDGKRVFKDYLGNKLEQIPVEILNM